MKKYLILTSLFALAACGGGGGGSGTSADRARPFDSGRIVSNETYNSNRHVTSMVSRLLVSQDKQHTLARAAVTSLDGVTYDEYDLSDVDFNFSDEGFGGLVKFGVDDNKKIVNFSIVDDDTGLIIDNNKVYEQTENGELYVDGNELKTHIDGGEITYDSSTGIYTYTSNNTDNNGTFKIINGEIYKPYDGDEFAYDENNKLISNDPSYKIIDGKIYSYETYDRTSDTDFTFDGKTTVEGGEQIDATLTYVSSGKDVPLRYSDFGYFELITDSEHENRPISVIGGYDAKRIANKNLPSSEDKIEFSGGASGSVVALKNGNVHTIDLKDKKATMTFANGTSTLNAEFGNWYNVKYSEQYDANGNAQNRTITYSNYTDTTTDRNGNMVDTDYFRMVHDDKTSNEFTLPNVTNSEQHGSNIDEFANVQSDIRYYGDNATPSEVVGLIQVRDCNGNQCGDVTGNRSDEVRMNIGFGGHHDVPTTNPRRN